MWRRSTSSPFQDPATCPSFSRTDPKPPPPLSLRPCLFLGPSESTSPRPSEGAFLSPTVALPTTREGRGVVAGPDPPLPTGTTPLPLSTTPFRILPPLDFSFSLPVGKRVAQRGVRLPRVPRGGAPRMRRFVNAPRTVRDGHNEAKSTPVRPPKSRLDPSERASLGSTSLSDRTGARNATSDLQGWRNGPAKVRVQRQRAGQHRIGIKQSKRTSCQNIDMSKLEGSSGTDGGLESIESEPNLVKAEAVLLDGGKNPSEHGHAHTQEELQRFRVVLTSHPLFPSLMKQFRETAELLNKLDPTTKKETEMNSSNPLQMPRLNVSFGDYPELDEFCVNYIARLKAQREAAVKRCSEHALENHLRKPQPKRPKIETDACGRHEAPAREVLVPIRPAQENPMLEAALSSLRQNGAYSACQVLAKGSLLYLAPESAPSQCFTDYTQGVAGKPFLDRSTQHGPSHGTKRYNRHNRPQREQDTQDEIHQKLAPQSVPPNGPLQKISNFLSKSANQRGQVSRATCRVTPQEGHATLGGNPGVHNNEIGTRKAPNIPDLNVNEQGEGTVAPSSFSIADAIRAAVSGNSNVKPARQGKTREKLSSNVIQILDKWFTEHLDNPYPCEKEKQALATECKISVNQVSNWFGNKRMRFKRKAMDSVRNQGERAILQWPTVNQAQVGQYCMNINAS